MHRIIYATQEKKFKDMLTPKKGYYTKTAGSESEKIVILEICNPLKSPTTEIQ